MGLTEGQLYRYNKYLESLKEQENYINERVLNAKKRGDLSENAEYDSAIIERTKLFDNISTVNSALEDTDKIYPPKSDTIIGIGSVIRLCYLSNDYINNADLLNEVLNDDSKIDVHIGDTGLGNLDTRNGEYFELVQVSKVYISETKINELSISSILGRALLNTKYYKNMKVSYTDYDGITRTVMIMELNNNYYGDTE